MKSLRILSLLVSIAGLTLFVPKAHADVSFDFFYNSLDPYGEWVETSDYGYVWHPSGIDEDWAPYSDGYWAYTDDGWTWVSYEDWGGITYHYGRWTRIEDEGWCWVPDSEWAPAWVSWRHSDDYVGWAPLPPRAVWRPNIGFSIWVDEAYDIGPGLYSFVAVRDFGAPALRPVIVNRIQNVTIIDRTVNITNITVNKNVVYVGGPSYRVLAAKSSRPIQTLKLVRQTDMNAIKASGNLLAKQQGNQLLVPAPKIQAPSDPKSVRPGKIARTLAETKPDHGWSMVTDPQVKEKLHAKMKADAKGLVPEKAPAKPVSAEEQKFVQEKINAPAAAANATVSPTPAMDLGKNKKGKGKNAPEEVTTTPPPAETTPAPTPVEPKGRKARNQTGVSAPETTPASTEGAVTPPEGKGKKVKGQLATPTPEMTPAVPGTPGRGKQKKGEAPLQPFLNPAEQNNPQQPPVNEPVAPKKLKKQNPEESLAPDRSSRSDAAIEAERAKQQRMLEQQQRAAEQQQRALEQQQQQREAAGQAAEARRQRALESQQGGQQAAEIQRQRQEAARQQMELRQQQIERAREAQQQQQRREVAPQQQPGVPARPQQIKKKKLTPQEQQLLEQQQQQQQGQ